MRGWQSVAATGSSVLQRSARASSSSVHAATVTRPPHYRKPHQHHKPKHMLQEEFPNAGDASGAGVRLFDYYKTADLVNALPTIKEKIDFVSPYERPWTAAEKTWRRDWHPSLLATRKAWALPRTPAYFDCLQFYQYITKTRLIEGSLDEYYKGLVPPTESFALAAEETLKNLITTRHFDSDEERSEAILAALFDEAVMCLAHNIPRLADYRSSYSVQSESFWVRAGFMFLYDEQDVVTRETERNLARTQKYTGDDRRKLGELAFVCRDQLAIQMRSREPLAPVVPLESAEVTKPIWGEDVDVEKDVLFAPRVFNLWPDEDPLWQCPGYFAESEETHTYSRLSAKSLRSMDERIDTWWRPAYGERFDLWDPNAKAQAVASLFTNLCAQAHTHGFTQYTDVTRPFTSQMVLSNGRDFVFAVGQLNTIAINIECDGFENDKHNLCYLEEPKLLWDTFDGTEFHYRSLVEGVKGPNGEEAFEHIKGLNPKVLERIMQMVMKN